MDKKKTNKKSDCHKTVKIDEDTHRELKIYTAKNNLKTLGDSVRDLLKKVIGKGELI